MPIVGVFCDRCKKKVSRDLAFRFAVEVDGADQSAWACSTACRTALIREWHGYGTLPLDLATPSLLRTGTRGILTGRRP